MPDLFHTYRADGAKIPTYFIESTAPNNVDNSPTPAAVLAGLTRIDPDQAKTSPAI